MSCSWSQYVQNGEIAKRFAVYYDLFTKYRSDYQIDRILDRRAPTPAVAERARGGAPSTSAWRVMGLVADALGGLPARGGAGGARRGVRCIG